MTMKLGDLILLRFLTKSRKERFAKTGDGNYVCRACRAPLDPKARVCRGCGAELYTLRGRLMRALTGFFGFFIAALSIAPNIPIWVGGFGVVLIVLFFYYLFTRPVHSIGISRS